MSLYQYPIKNWGTLPTGFRFNDTYPAGYGGLSGQKHIGKDVGNKNQYGWEIQAVSKGTIAGKLFGRQGGRTVHFIDRDGLLWRFLHLSGWTDTIGPVDKGTVLGWIGNTGLVRPIPTPQDPKAGTHTHIDISKNGKLELWNFNNFIDPDDYLLTKIIMSEFDHLEGWTIIGQTGRRAFVKGGLRHDFTSSWSDFKKNGYNHYLFGKNSKFIEDRIFDTIPIGTKSAEEILAGGQDWN